MFTKELKKIILGVIAYAGYEVTKLGDKRKKPVVESLPLSPLEIWLQSLNIGTVLDVGANTGQSALYFKKVFPEAKIYSFEPIKECFLEMQRNTQGLDDILAINVALGNAEGVQRFYKSIYSGASSLLLMTDLVKEIYPTIIENTAETVTVSTLDRVCKSLEIIPNVLLKMDVQGFEGKVLLGSKETLTKVSIIISEIMFQDLYHEQTSFSELYTLLTESGFVFKGALRTKFNPLNGLPLYSDAIFLREDLLTS